MATAGVLPPVGIVVPVKNSQAGIRACVESLLGQDYEGEIEIVLVGDVNDPTWGPIEDYILNGQIKILEAQIETARRDANAKRNIGLVNLDTPILVLTDSDMILPSSWVSTAVELIGEEYECVAGPMQSESKGFWPSYVDKNPLMSKTPRMGSDYVVTAENFGIGRAKPPITAAVAFTSSAFHRTAGLNDDFVNSYEDYEFFDRMTRLGVTILCTSRLVGAHSHREGFRALVRDYIRTGKGAADFALTNRCSKLATRRINEVVMLGVGLVVAIMLGALLIAAAPYWFYGCVITCMVMAFGLGLYCAWSARELRAIVFPFVTVLFGFASWCGFLHRWCQIRRSGLQTTITRAVINRSVSNTLEKECS